MSFFFIVCLLTTVCFTLNIIPIHLFCKKNSRKNCNFCKRVLATWYCKSSFSHIMLNKMLIFIKFYLKVLKNDIWAMNCRILPSIEIYTELKSMTSHFFLKYIVSMLRFSKMEVEGVSKMNVFVLSFLLLVTVVRDFSFVFSRILVCLQKVKLFPPK